MTELGRIIINDASSVISSISIADGDIFIISYDNDTDSISVTQNGSPITSGFVAFQQVPDVLSIIDNQYQFCDGSNLVFFTQILSFPYFQKNITINSPSCTDVVCDLIRIGSPVISAATDISTADGSATLQAFSTAQPVRWRFFGETQFSGNVGTTNGDSSTYTFSNLLPGNYTFLALDSNNCEISYNVTIPIASDYGLKYFFTFEDIKGNPKRVNIKQIGFVGSATELTDMGDDPVVLMQGRSDTPDKLKPIIGGGMMISLIAKTNSEWSNEFKQAGEKEYLVEFYDDPSGSNTLIQRGYIIPETGSEPLIHPPYPVDVMVTDGLADLQNELYSLNGEVLTGNASILEILSYALSFTKTGNGFRIAYNLYESNMDSGDADDPFTQVYVDQVNFLTDETSFSCYEVIEMLLKSLQAKIFSFGEYWYIQRLDELTAATLDYRQYTASGVYESNANYAVPVSIKGNTDTVRGRFIANSNNIRFDDVYNKINIVKQRNLALNLVREFTLENRNGEGFMGWTPTLGSAQGYWRAEESIKIPAARTSATNNNKRNKKTNALLALLPIVGVPLYSYKAYRNTLQKSLAIDRFQESTESKEVNEFALTGTFPVGTGHTSYVEYSGPIEFKSTDSGEISIKYIAAHSEIVTSQYLKYQLLINGKYYVQDSNTWTVTPTSNDLFIDKINEIQDVSISFNFDESINQNTTSTYRIRIYNFDPAYADVSATANLKNAIRAVSTSGRLSGSRLIASKPNSATPTSWEMYVYELAEDDSPSAGFSVLIPDDNSALRWLLKSTYAVNLQTGRRTFSTKLHLLKVTFVTFPDGNPIEENEVIEFDVDNKNAVTLDYNLPFFDLNTNVNNAEQLVLNYFKLADGTPTQSWGPESKNIHILIGEYLTKSFKFPLNIVDTQIFFEDVDCYYYNTVKDETDDNRIYMWNSYNYSVKNRIATGELAEIGSDTPVVFRQFDDSFDDSFA